MALFGRGDGKPDADDLAQRVATINAEIAQQHYVRHQSAVAELIDGFHSHDMAALAAMTPQERAEQERARAAMLDYLDGMWDDLNRRGLRPADHPGQYNAVAALRDLTSHLHFGAVQQAQREAGDEPE